MIPLRDTQRSKTIPFVNFTVIAICGAVFLYEAGLGEHLDRFIFRFAVVPASVADVYKTRIPQIGVILTLVTSMFLHGGWLHLMGNMLYLYIFGDNVEDRLGHLGYAFFYVLCGIGAAIVQVYSNPTSQVPLIGASGAIAGVLGAYFFLYPKSKILTLIPLFVFFPVIEISSFYFLGIWFVLQFVQGYLTSGAADVAGGGVAWWAHAGGFVVGVVLLPIFALLRKA
jgi:membrane associated rhomboid family serine protease